MTDRQFVLNSISELKNLRGNFKMKAERNIRIYEDTLNIALDDIRTENSIGFYKGGSVYDTTIDMSFNVIKSCIDTLTSKIAAAKVRPFFNIIKGSYKDLRVAQQAQHYFDQSFDKKNINKEITDCFRNSCIFDTGVIYIDPINKSIRNVLPWQVYYRPAEKTYGKLTRIYYERKQYPTSLLPNYKGTEEYVAYGVYYDINKHIYAEIFSDGKVFVHEYKSNVLPFVFINYTTPIIGGSSNSIVDQLLSIQIEINTLLNKVKDASQLSPANTIVVQGGSNVSTRKLSNGIGNVMGVESSNAQGGKSIEVVTPNFISEQYMQTILDLKQLASDMVGVSPLSQSGLKPMGLDSGKALTTMEDIETDRFQTQLNNVIRMYVDIAKTCMAVYNPDENILPADSFRSKITWKDIVDENNKMTIQFSSADALSKDPATKLQTLQQLAQTGVIPFSIISRYFEIPDLEKSYSLLNNTWEAVQTVIERCIDESKYEIPAFVPLVLLQQEIINTQLSLYSADPDNNVKDIQKLSKLFEVSLKMNNEMNGGVQ